MSVHSTNKREALRLTVMRDLEELGALLPRLDQALQTYLLLLRQVTTTQSRFFISQDKLRRLDSTRKARGK